jgi:hypothetical protein
LQWRFLIFFRSKHKDIFHGETANRIFSEITGKRHKVESEIEVECLSEKRVIKVITNPVFNEAGYLILLNFLGEDITEKRYLEEDLLKTKERLELVLLLQMMLTGMQICLLASFFIPAISTGCLIMNPQICLLYSGSF